MFKHYLKISFRNLWKYKSQTLISVIGLAVGFACFAMATLWIRYEMTYDGFHKNADRMYCVNIPDLFSKGIVSRTAPYPLAKHLKATFPEIANAVPVNSEPMSEIEIDDVTYNADLLEIDSSFFSIFDVKLVAGSMDFLIPGSKNIAVTVEKAKQLFGNDNPLGKKIMRWNGEHTVCAVVTGLSKHSNYPFDILCPFQPLQTKQGWAFFGMHTIIEVVSSVDVEAFGKKLYEHAVPQKDHITTMTLTPITSIRYKDSHIKRDVKFQHVFIFAIAGSLLIICTLFNYLTLFVSRFRIRQRELALRAVFGASNRSLFTMLSVEFFISLLIALLCGLILILEIIPIFRELSGIKLELLSIYSESLIYIAGIIAISLLTFVVTLAMFRRRTLDAGIRLNNKKMFRKISIIFQLTVSIGFAFCSIIMLKQMYYLHNTDLGFAIKNCGSVVIYDPRVDISVLDDKIRQIPEITGTVKNCTSLMPLHMRLGWSIDEWDDKPENAKSISIGIINISEDFLSYHEIKPLEGELVNNKDSYKDVLINESAVKAFGWHNAVGKKFKFYDEHVCTVKGVIKNIYNMSPTISAKPVFYTLENPGSPVKASLPPIILFKFNDGAWQTCRKKIEEIIKSEFPNVKYDIYSSEKEYDEFLKSENTLLKILSLVSLVCVIVCVFGFVSMVSLTCEERRKEIAIRKINGATVKDILDIFFKEYLLLLIVGALIAFPSGYLIMKPWLENYVLQTEISAWIYILILLVLIVILALCVGGKVYRASRENPVESIKN